VTASKSLTSNTADDGICVTDDVSGDVTAGASESESVVVDEEDFNVALLHLTPSLSAAELHRYDQLQHLYTLRHHDND